MPAPNQLISSASRYIAGRNAVQTVYWKTGGKQQKLVKLSKTCNFLRGPSGPSLPPRTMADMLQVKLL